MRDGHTDNISDAQRLISLGERQNTLQASPDIDNVTE
jgi:hypothetical protein